MECFIGSVIKSGREKKKISQKELAKIMKVHQTQISQWESGATRIHGEALLEIASVLEIKEELFGCSLTPNQQNQHNSLLDIHKRLEKLEKQFKQPYQFFEDIQIVVIENNAGMSLVLQEALNKLAIGCYYIQVKDPQAAIRILEKNSAKKTSLIIAEVSQEFLQSIAKDSKKYNQIPIIAVIKRGKKLTNAVLEYTGIFIVLKAPLEVKDFCGILDKFDLAWPLRNQKKSSRNPKINLLSQNFK